MEGVHVQLLLEGQLILEECTADDAAAQEAQGARLYGLVYPPRCPLCACSGMLGAQSIPDWQGRAYTLMEPCQGGRVAQVLR